MVVHIFGKPIKHNKLVSIGLAKGIFGIGYTTAARICAKVGIYPQMRVNQLSENQIMDINKEVSELLVEGHLKQKINNDIKLKRSIGSYVGMRHALGYPVRGQGTRNNAKNAKKFNRVERYKL
ncbi:uncharacterized protein SPAPADRAFT_59244 [Spathaspora passalidarum NRRL Y-27907]|uniref:Small ribosomal subunit protein uS13m n=1 Tax=Spathaspora passalidarum (strain NRRL Y-27907 / 11-Y1) TaxID=619300 RepID=G3AJG8_SPAPN|nr:uncharacterized protein SPAPADRAFT_59244 [Spathaspora passalidarum NRRL Y-27907]EGW33871.1 hypothetical protein SPAPADRAFT_59244 [Spathaspora passalidarum NRRL Y-27907]